MSTTIRVRSQITRRASGKHDPEDTVEITTDDTGINVAKRIRELHEEVWKEQQHEIARREAADNGIQRSRTTTSLTG